MNEIRIEIGGLKELAEAVKALAAARGGQAAPVTMPPAQQYPAPTQQMPPAGPSQQSCSQIPAQPAMHAGTGMPQLSGGMAPVSAVPTTAMPQEYTIEQLQVAAAGLSGLGKMPQVLGILQRFGIQAMTELPRERYGEFATALREAGAQI